MNIFRVTMILNLIISIANLIIKYNQGKTELMIVWTVIACAWAAIISKEFKLW